MTISLYFWMASFFYFGDIDVCDRAGCGGACCYSPDLLLIYVAKLKSVLCHCEC